jgi:hypothetical protein
VINIEKLLPKWVMRRYLLLWKTLGDKEFEFEDALRILKKQLKPDDKRIVALFLSELKKAGWLDVKLNPLDGRKRIYSLKGYDDIFTNIVADILHMK